MLALLLAGPSLLAQEPKPFSGETRVVATDVVVDVLKKETLLSGAREPRRQQGPEDFQLRIDGERVSVVGVEPPGSEAEPWSLVIYLDTTLHDTQELRWAAALLVEEAETLTSLGTVTVVEADPEPRTVVAPTRDADAVAQALSDWALEADGEGALVALREAVLDTGGEDLDPRDLVGLETALVRDRLDVFLIDLVEHLPATARRAVLPLGLGFDLQPEAFYGIASPPAEDATSLAALTRDLGRSLGAYGWVTLPLAAPLPENRAKTKPGLRIGKFRLGPGKDFGMWIRASYEEDRNPKKARAHYEVGVQQMKAGQTEDAVESFKKALFHFYGDPRTGKEQIRAYEALARALEALGDAEGARRAEEAARELAEHPKVLKRQQKEATKAKKAGAISGSSSGETAATTAGSELAETGAGSTADGSPPEPRSAGVTDIDPEAALDVLVSATAGFAVRNAEQLGEALESLGRRYRLTFPLEARYPGRLLELQVQPSDPAFAVTAPAFARSSTPEPVAAARLRRLLTSELPNEGGDLDAEVLEPGPEDSLAIARVALDLSPHARPGDALRLTYAQAGDDSRPRLHHLYLPAESSTTGAYTLELPRDEERPGLILLLDNLTTGTWAATILEP
ncbi:MAG: hypothetical protein KDD47_08645 [Acidobacteria bacterium]|nr:hypothetical protein [Acidobacteriota bacterium]